MASGMSGAGGSGAGAARPLGEGREDAEDVAGQREAEEEATARASELLRRRFTQALSEASAPAHAVELMDDEYDAELAAPVAELWPSHLSALALADERGRSGPPPPADLPLSHNSTLFISLPLVRVYVKYHELIALSGARVAFAPDALALLDRIDAAMRNADMGDAYACDGRELGRLPVNMDNTPAPFVCAYGKIRVVRDADVRRYGGSRWSEGFNWAEHRALRVEL